MAVNFCNEDLIKISCDQVCGDHHDVQNLVSSTEADRQRGFMVDYYIRPPVTIRIEFTKHNFDLMYLQLGLQLRQHRSKGIEVYASNNLTDQEGQLIAKCHSPSQESFTIVNSCYRPSRHLPEINSAFPDSFYIAGRNIKFCSNVKRLKIKVISTVNSTVPCLSHIHLYGKPSGVYGDDLRAFVKAITEKKTTIYDAPCTDQQSISRVEPSTRDLSQQIEHLAPPEFFDAITNELMKSPFMLPSGKNIDKISLNKFLATKSDYTPPCDPFTRVPFTEQNKPVLNVELKSRIDLFLATNGQSEINRRNELRRRLLNLPN